LDKIFLKRAIVVLMILSFFSLEGCEAFRKKFIRKKQVEEEAEEQVILEPQVYPDVVYDNPTLYKNYYTFCKAWYGDLLDSLNQEGNYKKQLQCFSEVIKNLSLMRDLLKTEKQQEISSYIEMISKNKEKLMTASLKDAILPQLKNDLSSIEKKIVAKFSYSKIKDNIK